MTLVLTPARQRAIAIASLVLIVVLVVTAVLLPVWSSFSLHAERVDMLKRQASTMEGFANAAPRFEAATKKLAANADARSLTFAAPQPALAVAQLQSQLGQLIAGASAVVSLSQPLSEAHEGALTKISVQTMVEGDVKALIKLLYDIDAARPLLRLEKLTIRDPDGDWSAGPQANAPNKLQVELVVSAYMRTP